MSCHYSFEWTFQKGETVCVKFLMPGQQKQVEKKGVYVGLVPARSNNPGSWHPGHYVNVDGQNYIFAAGDVGKVRSQGGAKKKHQTKRRKTHRSKKTRSRK